MTRFAGCALLSLLLITPLAAQPSTSTTLRLASVSVPVTVLDAEGKPVPALKASDFDLFEDGKRQPLTGFRVVDFSMQPASALARVERVARRSFVLLFDLGTSPASRERAQEAARRFVKDVALPRDLIAVGTVDAVRGFHLLSAFTTDRELTGAAIDDPRGFRGNDPLQIANQTVIFNGGGTAAETQPPPAAAPAIDQAVAQRIDKATDAAGQLASALRRVPGRKQIILLTEDADVPAQPRDLVEKVVRNFRNGDSLLHVLDTGSAKAGAFASLAHATGGSVLRTSQDLSEGFAQILRRQQIVYVLTFDSVITGAPAKFHELSIRVPNVPHAAVIHRGGHYEAGNESGFERVIGNAELLINDVPSDDLHMSTLAAPFAAPTGNAQLPVIVDVEGVTLVSAAANGVPIDVFIYAFDANGIVRDRIFQRLSLDPAKTAETLRRGGLKYVGTLALPPGKYAVRTLVTAGDAKGFRRLDVDVRPPKQTALLPPLFLDDPKNWVLVRGTTHGTAPYPFQLNGEPFVPSARMTVKNGVPQKVAVFVQNVAPNDLLWQLSITDASGHAHDATPSASMLQGEGVSKLLLDYTPTGLQPGPATANISIMKRSSNESQRTSAAMVVLQ